MLLAILIVLVIIMLLLSGLAASARDIFKILGTIELVEVSTTRFPNGTVESTLISKTKFEQKNRMPMPGDKSFPGYDGFQTPFDPT